MQNINFYFKFQDFHIRKVLKDDILKLVPLINESYSYIEGIRKKSRTNSEDLLERIQESDYYVVLDHKNVIGCFYSDVHVDGLHFGMFALLSEYRSIGLGKEIIRAIECFAKSINIKTIEIDRMSVSPWLKKYYENQGYVETGKIEHWGDIDLIHMSKDIY